MVETEGDPASDPVVLWLNGGPGCSSFDGFIYEHGPFLYRFTEQPSSSNQESSSSDVKLVKNPHSWSRSATMIYLDSPSAVGLSFSSVAADYTTNDTATAADSHTFLRKFFKRYPHLQDNDFYISGESYAGIYVPMLTREVVAGNKQGRRPHINIRGYLVGNGCTDAEFDGNARVPFAAGKSLISAGTFTRLQRACQNKFYNAPAGSRCAKLLSEVDKDLSALNLYNVLEDCYLAKGTQQAQQDDRQQQQQQQHLNRVRQLLQDHTTWPVRGVVPQGAVVQNWQQLLGHNPPCTLSQEADVWLNNPAVRRALHAAPIQVTGKWTICSDRIHYTANGGSMLPIHRQLTKEAGLCALIYSGDHDLCVPHTGSEAWTAAIHHYHHDSDMPDRTVDGISDDMHDSRAHGVAKPWQPWFSSAQPPQVAGYLVEYTSGLTYATVKGAGHMVPQTRPLEALDMFTRFIQGKPLVNAKQQAQ
eukprot:GHRR01013270.1.p1 GENE.GHRR01013270.1~~GHRR01013270.1.p1  ORF type:complete len:474 (+),score=176.66 GHRR01013270.1:695-2116(+)